MPIPAHLPQRANLTTPESPWPLRVLSQKMDEYINKMSPTWIEAEVLQYNARPGSKTQYLTLKDTQDDISINVSIYTHLLPPTIEAGSKVVTLAKPSFWKKNGSLNLWAQEMRPVGLGDILLRLEQLKQQLANEGLFDQAKKKPLPFLPKKIGLICGRNTDALRDVTVNSAKRWPSVQFEIREVQVQGERAVPAIIPALQELDAIKDVDVIVLARGGGSFEDLLTFSDETLVRAVYATHTPVVSAIGHERDNPLLDYVADMRASTPTDAAKRIVPDVAEEYATMSTALDRMRTTINRQIFTYQNDLDNLQTRPVMASPHEFLKHRQVDCDNLYQWLGHHARQLIDRNSSALNALYAQLEAYSPKATLKRGYSVTLDESGNIVSQASSLSEGTKVTTVVHQGSFTASVTSTKEEEQHG